MNDTPGTGLRRVSLLLFASPHTLQTGISAKTSCSPTRQCLHRDVILLKEVGLTRVFSSIAHLTGLQGLYLEDNQITEVHSFIGRLTSLRELRLFHNRLSSVASSVDKLTSLQELRLGTNQILIVLLLKKNYLELAGRPYSPPLGDIQSSLFPFLSSPTTALPHL